MPKKVDLVEGKAPRPPPPTYRTQIACGTRRGLHGVVGRHADDDQLFDPRFSQTRLQPRRAKRIRHLFLNQSLAWQWLKPLLKFDARLLWPEHRVLRAGQVLHMNDRPPAATPVAQERQHAIFGPGIVAPAESGVKDAFLLIDDDQCRVFSSSMLALLTPGQLISCTSTSAPASGKPSNANGISDKT